MDNFNPLNEPKPRVRVRPNLTSFQISDQQKVVIDQAYEKFRASSEINATKGEFVEALCMNFLRGKGGAVTDASVPQEFDTQELV